MPTTYLQISNRDEFQILLSLAEAIMHFCQENICMFIVRRNKNVTDSMIPNGLSLILAFPAYLSIRPL